MMHKQPTTPGSTIGLGDESSNKKMKDFNKELTEKLEPIIEYLPQDEQIPTRKLLPVFLALLGR